MSPVKRSVQPKSIFLNPAQWLTIILSNSKFNPVEEWMLNACKVLEFWVQISLIMFLFDFKNLVEYLVSFMVMDHLHRMHLHYFSPLCCLLVFILLPGFLLACFSGFYTSLHSWLLCVWICPLCFNGIFASYALGKFPTFVL